jgi:uncharacterized protein YwgA
MQLKKNVAISETGFIFDAESGESFSTNPIGQDLLNAIKDSKSKEEIIAQIMEEYDVNKETIETHLYDFIKMLEQFNLLEKQDHE